MKLFAAGLGFVLLLAPAAVAQDMPLSTFVKVGESWRRVDGTRPTAAADPTNPPKDLSGPPRRALVTSPDGGTVFAEHPDGKAVWAYAIGKDGQLVGGEPYCPLRLRKGQEKLAVTSLTVDADGRVYAATLDGVQVFDPTGRLSGVLLLPAKGTPEHLAWEGEGKNVLTVWVGDAKYARTMKATGAK